MKKVESKLESIRLVLAFQNWCKYLKRESYTCMIGCSNSHVKKNGACPFETNEEAQDNCECYKG